jgi:HNH endonuclease
MAIKPNPIGDRTCLICGTAFRVVPAIVRRGGGTYCSRVCSGLGRRGERIFRTPLAIRFADKWKLDETTGCWVWTACTTQLGYGQIALGGQGGGHWLAHRASWLLHRGNPGKLGVLHECDNPSCVNPDHLFLGTQADNLADAARKGRTDRTRKPKGETNGNAKLTALKVLRIRASKEPAPVAARKFGVQPGTVHSIRQHRSWRHI